MSNFSTCSVQFENWLPAIITFAVVFVAVSMLTCIDKKKVLLLTLLPCRVIILGILWSGSPQSESVQLDLSFNEVSVGAVFILLVKELIEAPFRKKPNEDYSSRLILYSLLALVPASLELLYIQDHDTAQWLTGTVCIAVVTILLLEQTKQNPPEKEIHFSVGKIFKIALLLAMITLFSSFADCMGGELWAGLICAFPIDSLVILYHVLEDMKKDRTGPEQKSHLLSQVIYLVALSTYIHFTMTVVIYFSSKWEFIKNMQGAWPIVAMIVIAAVSTLIVFVAIDLFGWTKRIERKALKSMAGLLNIKPNDSIWDETSEEKTSFLTKTHEMSSGQHRTHEKETLRL